VVGVLRQRLVDKLEDNTHLPTVLQSLGCIAQNAMPIFETREDDIIKFVVRNVLRRPSPQVEVCFGYWMGEFRAQMQTLELEFEITRARGV
jgi:hypothetical protein